MSPLDNILLRLFSGRAEAANEAATALAHTLSDVEALVRKLQPPATPPATPPGAAADLAELAEMRQALDGADYAPTLAGLRNALEEAERAVRVWKEGDESLRADRDRLVAEVDRVSLERDRAAANLAVCLAICSESATEPYPRSTAGLKALVADLQYEGALARSTNSRLCGEIDAHRQEIEALRRQVDELTPGPWRRFCDAVPAEGERVLVYTGVPVDASWLCAYDSRHPWPPAQQWRRLPAAGFRLPTPEAAPTEPAAVAVAADPSAAS